MKYLNQLQLQKKLFVLGVLPAAILAIILALFFTNSRLNEVNELFLEKEKNLAIAIAQSSVYGVFSGDKELLKNIIRSVIVSSDLRRIIITDQHNKQIVQVTKNGSVTPTSIKNIVTTTQAIEIEPIQAGDEMDELFFNTKEKNPVIGYITIHSSILGIKQRQTDILLNSVYITVFSLTIIGFIAYAIGKSIGRPILRLARDTIKIKEGQYQLPEYTFPCRDEISILSQGISDMAQELETNQFRQERKIREATQELERQNDLLTSAQQKIIKTAEAKSRFVSHISHEIRTPLNGIIGFLDMIQETPLSKEQKELVGASVISSKNLHEIINEVLDLAQLEAGKIKLNKSNFHLLNTINEILSTLAYQALDNSVTISLQAGELLPTHIHQDPTKLGQILLNLMSNAIKFSPNTTVTLKVTRNLKQPNELNFSIIDEGIGIDKNNMSELFNAFTQFESPSFCKGTGLGLTITNGIVRALHGELSVKSAVGKGSTFAFNFPFTPVSESYSPIISTAATSRITDLTGVNILVADDNEINRQLLARLLVKQNATVDCVNDGQQAYDSSLEKTYSLLLLDLRMPFKMGHEVLRDIRSNNQHLNYRTPAIAITAHVTSGVERANHINNFDGYLVKPIDRLELLNLIQQLLDGNSISSQESLFIAPVETSRPQETEMVFDLQSAQTSIGNDKELIYLIVDRFISKLPEQLDELKNELKENANNAADIVHQIHGSTAYCGTTLLKNCSKALEEKLRDKPTDDISEAINNFYIQATKLIEMKDSILASIKESSNDNASSEGNH